MFWATVIKHYTVYRSNNNVSFPSITDAFNETKDKVKYLESLHKYFDQLLLVGNNSLVNICSNTLPGLMASVRQMDSISRFYARNGYLGLLFSKVKKYNFFSGQALILSSGSQGYSVYSVNMLDWFKGI